MVLGLKFSLTTSAVAINLCINSIPSGVFISTAMLFLLRLNIGKKPAPDPNKFLVLSPSIGSTLITSAPKSAKIIPQVGPITIWVNSTTRMPSYGSPLLLFMHHSIDLPEQILSECRLAEPCHKGIHLERQPVTVYVPRIADPN